MQINFVVKVFSIDPIPLTCTLVTLTSACFTNLVNNTILFGNVSFRFREVFWD